MELELERTELNGYETVLDTTLTQEETLEAIVPDACPDILRVCTTEGMVFLSRKEALEGRVECAGTVRATLLYLPDGAEGLRRMEVQLPFTAAVARPEVTAGCRVVAEPRAQSADTRLLNPRKVLVRVCLAVDLRVYAPAEESICGGVSDPGDAGVEQWTERCDTCVTVSVQEKPFTFSDEMTLPGGKPEAEEMLKHRVALRCGEAKVIGNKLIFKGEAQLQALYRAVGGELCTAEYELPFSQIMEVSGAGEEASCQVGVVLTGADCALDGGGGRTLSVSMGLLAQAVVREERTVPMLTDVYSTAYELEADTGTYTLSRLLDRGEKEVSAREILETGLLAQDVSDAFLTIGAVTQNREGERLSVTAEANVTVLYRTEDGGASSVTRTIPVSCPLDLPEGAACSCQCFCPAPVFATPTAGGLEVRFAVGFRYLALSTRTVAAVSDVRLDENKPRDHAGQPSIVLRMVGPGERLWDIAKSYGTTARDIIQANGLEEEAVPDGQLLLIPRKR